MTTPADLVSHYSTKALQTRMAALASIGALLGADVAWDEAKVQSGVLGIALLVIVGSLAELNRRYTHSYLCACRAAARSSESAQMWRDFTTMNERPYSRLRGEVERVRTQEEGEAGSRRGILSRFLLSWGTYLPGIVAGLYLVWAQFGRTHEQYQPRVWVVVVELAAAHVVAAVLVMWWWVQSSALRNPERVLDAADRTPNSESTQANKAMQTDAAAPRR